ncbi:hypothetical protein KFK09_001547 [Dendrobium nobile]|uniref:Uncharacterized protein n=1 Tax=Dendrobium nobile TaxID=94219 RepID=A0A8T3CB74_DENNO|nr:hypothetical protein KFK09_001547 [Dendrobium nobile]
MKTEKGACALTFRFQRVFVVFWHLGRSSSSPINQTEADNHLLFRSQPRSESHSLSTSTSLQPLSPVFHARAKPRPIRPSSANSTRSSVAGELDSHESRISGSLPHLFTESR